MPYSIRTLACNPNQLPGLSEKLVVSHYENNYSGAVKRLNLISEQLASFEWANAPGYVINGLKREELIAMNSMLLHELYFESLGASIGKQEFLDQLQRDFGSFESWAEQFSAMGKAMAGGSGWVLLTWQPRDRKLVNTWCSDHTHSIAGATPLLALDMYEHSYHIDYGAKAAAYVDAFMNNLNLADASRKFLDLKHINL